VRTFLFLGLPLLLFLACAERKPRYLSDPTAHPRFPTSAYLCAVGLSEESQAQAELNAKAALAAQLSAKISSVFKRDFSSTAKRQGAAEPTVEEYQRFTQQTVLETSFDRAELLHLDHRSAFLEEGKFYAVAYVVRRELAAEYERGYQEAEQRFRPLAEEARTAFTNRDFAVFKRNAEEARPHYAALVAFDAKLQALGQSDRQRQERNDQLLLGLLGDLATWRARTSLTLLLAAGVPAERRSFWLDTLTAALAGIAVRAEYPPGPDPFALALDLAIDEQCRQVYLGHQCELQLSARLIAVDGSRLLLTLDFPEPRPSGHHASERERALQKAYKVVDRELLRTYLIEKLAAYVPPTIPQPSPNEVP